MYCNTGNCIAMRLASRLRNCIAREMRGIAREGVLYCNTLLEDIAGSVLQYKFLYCDQQSIVNSNGQQSIVNSNGQS